MNIERITCILIHSCLPGWYMDFDPLVPLAKRLRPFTQSPEFYAETLCTEMLDNFLVLATVPKSRKLVIKLESLQMQFEDTMKVSSSPHDNLCFHSLEVPLHLF
eukprot:m.699438 g.699438  ORF g.699438 m.699438 type:complete len:104 (+) comp58692_c0_seq16:80-391(+)